MSKKSNVPVSVENIYNLEGRVPVLTAIPFGLQHVLAMFISNVTPIILICLTAGITGVEQARLVQSAMFVAGIGSLIQMYPIWRIGSKLPVIMGISFTFLASLQYVAMQYGYGAMVGAIIVGGCFEGCLGLTVKYWKKFIDPIVSACVVTTIGLSLLGVGATSFAGGAATLPSTQEVVVNGETLLKTIPGSFGNADFMILGTITLVTCLIVNIFAKGFWKQLSVLFGLIVGYITAIIMTSMGHPMIDFSSFNSTISQVGYFSLPKFMPFTPEFNLNAIIAIAIVFIVSAVETIGDTTALVNSGLNRDITNKELSGSLCCDGFLSAFSGLFGCTPITSFSQNVGLVAMTKVVNRFTIMFGALTLILSGLFPPIGAFFSTLPQPVLGGCTILMFGSIITTGISMMSKCGFNQRNITIASLSISIGVGFPGLSSSGLFKSFPKLIADVFGGNPVACVFIIALVLSLLLPKDMDIKRLVNTTKVKNA